MPAVQVRDFPEDLYERFKAQAERDHRSVAAELIYAAERVLEEANREQETTEGAAASAARSTATAATVPAAGATPTAAGAPAPATTAATANVVAQPPTFPYRIPNTISAESIITGRYIETPEERAERAKRRRALLAEVHEFAKTLPKDLPDPVNIIREMREERDRVLTRNLPGLSEAETAALQGAPR